MWEDVANTNGGGNTHKEIRFGFCIPAGGMEICELSPRGNRQPIPVLLHVQLVSQQEHGAAALAALRVQGEHLEVALAALEALPVVDAVDNKEGAGPAQVALAVPGAILGVRGAAELQSSRGPAMAQLVITPPMPYLVSSVHHLQEHRLLVHQLLRGVGVLCKKKRRRVVVRMGWHILSSSKPSKAQDAWDTMEKFQP